VVFIEGNKPDNPHLGTPKSKKWLSTTYGKIRAEIEDAAFHLQNLRKLLDMQL
jgi:hypothetical protein